MAKYFLRMITDCCCPDVSEAIVSFLAGFHFVSELCIAPIKPYWKAPEQGELLCSFISALPIAKLRAALAEHWEGDVADAQWSRIHIHHAFFLWLCAE